MGSCKAPGHQGPCPVLWRGNWQLWPHHRDDRQRLGNWSPKPKSKSAVHIYAGNCLLYSFTHRQTVIAQSSAEAEFYATASGVSEGVLIRKVLAFFGVVLGLQALTDSSANNPMTHRLGVGKIRHLETKGLWLQQLVYRGFLTMSWSPGRYNNSDLGTKVLGKALGRENWPEGLEGVRCQSPTGGNHFVHPTWACQTTDCAGPDCSGRLATSHPSEKPERNWEGIGRAKHLYDFLAGSLHDRSACWLLRLPSVAVLETCQGKDYHVL